MINPSGAKTKVLLVDDDIGVLALTMRWLVEDGCEVIACHSVESARACLRGFTPDVLVTDVRVAGANGFFLAVIGSQQTPPIRSVVVSGFGDAALEAEAKALNAPFLGKPLNRSQLLLAVKQANTPIQ